MERHEIRRNNEERIMEMGMANYVLFGQRDMIRWAS